MALPHAILVSLCEQAGSGYELARRFDRSIGYFWAATHQQIYRTLRVDGGRRLGATSTSSSSRAGRTRRSTRVTDAGRAELARWIAEPLTGRGSSVDRLAHPRTGGQDPRRRVRRRSTRCATQVVALRRERAELLDTYLGFEKRQFPDPAAPARRRRCTSTWCCAAASAPKRARSTGSTKYSAPWEEHRDRTLIRICCPRWISASPPCATGSIMGSMHTGLEDRARDIDRLAAYFAERARGGVGLIITGGYAPNRTGWLLPFAAQMLSSSEARRHRRITSAVHDEGGKILLQVLHAGRYAYHPLSVSASSIKAPINPFRPRSVLARRRGHHRRLRALRAAGPRGRLRRRRDHGQRGLSAQPVPRAAHQQAHRRMGRHAGEAPTHARRDRASHPRGGRDATSSSATGCRWPTTSRTARAGTRSSRSQPKSRPPAPPSSTPASAGTRPGCPRS